MESKLEISNNVCIINIGDIVLNRKKLCILVRNTSNEGSLFDGICLHPGLTDYKVFRAVVDQISDSFEILPRGSTITITV